MNTRHKTLWIAIVAAGFAMAAGVRAQDEYGFEDTSAAKPGAVYENFIEIGGGYTDDGNGKFGEYTTGVTDALQDEGGFPVGALRLSGGDDSTARSWEVSAGVGNGRSLEASYGIQNSFGISLYGDRIEKAEYGEAGTVYDGVSETMLLPATYSFTTSFPIPAAPPGSYDRANYSTEDIRHERQIFGLEGFKHIGDAWTLSLGFENQDKSGDDVFGGNQGFSGTALVPEELDTRHQQMRARIDYADRCLQQGIELYLSDFENGNDAIAYQNAIVPGSYVPNNASGAFRPLGLEQVASEPDNRYLRVGMDGGYSVGMMTRLSWFADWSRGEQDEDFLPVVLDTNYYPSVNPVFPFSNLDGEVERANVKLSLVGRPFSRFDYRVQYAYKDRDARHDPLPVNELSYTYNNTAPGFTSKVYDKQTQALGAEAGYRFAGRVKLRGGYEYEEADRDTDETGVRLCRQALLAGLVHGFDRRGQGVGGAQHRDHQGADDQAARRVQRHRGGFERRNRGGHLPRRNSAPGYAGLPARPRPGGLRDRGELRAGCRGFRLRPVRCGARRLRQRHLRSREAGQRDLERRVQLESVRCGGSCLRTPAARTTSSSRSGGR